MIRGKVTFRFSCGYMFSVDFMGPLKGIYYLSKRPVSYEIEFHECQQFISEASAKQLSDWFNRLPSVLGGLGSNGDSSAFPEVRELERNKEEGEEESKKEGSEESVQMTVMNPCCMNCQFWSHLPDEDHRLGEHRIGECQFDPPRIMEALLDSRTVINNPDYDNVYLATRWPVTEGESICGKWKEK